MFIGKYGSHRSEKNLLLNESVTFYAVWVRERQTNADLILPFIPMLFCVQSISQVVNKSD